MRILSISVHEVRRPIPRQSAGVPKRSRIDAALKELDGSGITVSVDTLNPWVLDGCLRHEIHAINDISGLTSETYTRKVAESKLPAFLMASNSQPGDFLLALLQLPLHLQKSWSGASSRNRRICPGSRDRHLDPLLRSVEDDWTLCRHFADFLQFDHPLLAAIPRETFIGDLLNLSRKIVLQGALQ